jgi:hypothetical protein
MDTANNVPTIRLFIADYLPILQPNNMVSILQNALVVLNHRPQRTGQAQSLRCNKKFVLFSFLWIVLNVLFDIIIFLFFTNDMVIKTGLSCKRIS